MSAPVTIVIGAALNFVTLRILDAAGVPMSYPLALSLGVVIGCILTTAQIAAWERES